MNSRSWPQVKELFFEAVELEEKKQLEFLEELARKNPDVAEEVLSLLRSHREADAHSSLKKIPSRILKSALDDVPRFSPGETVSQFRIIKEIGRGALATVYVAHDTALDRLVAVKVGSVKNENEARLLASLDHPHIVRVYSTLNENRYSLICMQYLEGRNLAEHLELMRNPTTESVVSILHQMVSVAEALDHAHRKGLLHLDIKPANLLFDSRGRLHLGDFNVSLSKSDLELGHVKGFGGTEKYMAPEQLAVMRSSEGAQAEAAKQVGPHSDVYSWLRVTLEIAQLLPSRGDRLTCLRDEIFALKSQALPTADRAAQNLKGLLRRHSLETNLPPFPKTLDWVKHRPLLAIAMATLLPQIFGSVVNILYNHSQIISHFSEATKVIFFRLCLFYNLLSYPICVFYYLRALKNIAQGQEPALRLPRHVWMTTSLGWLTGALVFPLALSLSAGLSPELYGHFIFSFLISWLVAGVYSTLFSSYIVYYSVYLPRWDGHPDQGKAMVSFRRHLRALPLLAGLVPLFGSLVAVLGNPSEPADQVTFRGLLVALLIVGIIALPVTQKICSHLENSLERQQNSQ